MKRNLLPTVLGGLLGLVVILDAFVKQATIQTISKTAMSWIVTVAGFAMMLGAINMIMIHSKRIQTKTKDYDESVVLLLSLTTMIFTGIFLGSTSKLFRFLFDNVQLPISATLFSTMVFWIASAAYRTFRAKNVTALVVLSATFLTILGNAPLMEALNPSLPAIAQWMMGPPTAGAQRAVLMCGAIGSIALGLRVLLGIERGHMSAAGSE
ncbi:MAG: hypothetical protein Q8P50_05940 [Bacillota bacterium]|nr:hypothetical protein [Bacillota bacterium]